MRDASYGVWADIISGARQKEACEAGEGLVELSFMLIGDMCEGYGLAAIENFPGKGYGESVPDTADPGSDEYG